MNATPILLLAGLGGLVWAASAGASTKKTPAPGPVGPGPDVAPPPTLEPGVEEETIDDLVIGQTSPLLFAQDPTSPNSFYYGMTAYPVALVGEEPVVRYVITDESMIPLVTNDNGASFLSDVSAFPTYFDQLTGEVIVEAYVGTDAYADRYSRQHYLNLPTEPPFGDGENLPIVWWRSTRATQPINTSDTRYTRIK
jgi:hypothetical protein